MFCVKRCQIYLKVCNVNVIILGSNLFKGRDDVTGEPLIQRDDDHPDTILARLNDYKRTTMPVLDFFRFLSDKLFLTKVQRVNFMTRY